MYKQIMSSLRYLCNSRINICYTLGIISKFMSEPIKSHLMGATIIFVYLKGTMSLDLLFSSVMGEKKA